jgi:hypothetical protein
MTNYSLASFKRKSLGAAMATRRLTSAHSIRQLTPLAGPFGLAKS